MVRDMVVGVQVEDSMEDGTPADQHMRKIAVHVSAYITHVRTQLKQTIPKAIVHCLVRCAALLLSGIQFVLGGALSLNPSP